MGKENERDLRYIKTEKLIRETFCKMLWEMEYAQITIRELTQRAMINRKTFYLHYSSLDELLGKLQTELYVNLLESTAGLELPGDLEKLVREMYLFTMQAGGINEKILCSQGNFPFGKSPADYVRKELFCRFFPTDIFAACPPLECNLINAYLNGSFIYIYTQWLTDDKKMPLEEVICLTTKLMSRGIKMLTEPDENL